MIDDDQIYVVVDIEADGPVPGLYSMLSFGAVAMTKDGEQGTFYKKVTALPGAVQHPATMQWWETQPVAWQEATTNAEDPSLVMDEFCNWLSDLGKNPVFVAHPVAFDYAFISWYLWKFAGKNPFVNEKGASITLDLTSYISGKYSQSLTKSMRSNLAEWMKNGMPEHSHNALDDAKGFAVILINILRSNKQ